MAERNRSRGDNEESNAKNGVECDMQSKIYKAMDGYSEQRDLGPETTSASKRI